MKKAKSICGLLMAVMMAASLQGPVFAADRKDGAAQDGAALLTAKAEQLKGQYGVLQEGEQVVKVDSKEYYTSMMYPFDEKTDGGIIFTDIRDYDRDGAPELLAVRRNLSTGSIVYDDAAYDEELYEYTYEMYEAEGGECVLAASRNIDVYDVMNWSINFKSLTVFLHETDQYTDIFTETFISQQDHPSDTGLVRLRYNGKDFAEEDGIRTGFWYTEDGVRCMQPVSAEALHYLSDNFPTEDRFWTDLVTADTEEDETFIKVRDEKLGQLGLKLVKTRQDFTDSYSVEEMNDEQLAQMDIDFAAISAIDCYMPAGGTETRLAFITEYTDRLMDEDGMTNINRLVSLEKIAVE